MTKAGTAMLCGALAWLLATNVFAAAKIKIFTDGSYAEVVKKYQAKPFVLVLWSLDCPPCYRELALLAQEYKRHPFNLVLISVDGIEASSEVAAVLARYQLDDVDAWLFEDSGSQRLRYTIDPHWYGELPRSFIFNTLQQRQAVSGVLRKEQLPQ